MLHELFVFALPDDEPLLLVGKAGHRFSLIPHLEFYYVYSHLQQTHPYIHHSMHIYPSTLPPLLSIATIQVIHTGHTQ